MTLARSCGLPRPAKVILVPGANARGLVSHCAQIVPVPGAALLRQRIGEGEALCPCRSARQARPTGSGQARWRRPWSTVWQAAHLLKTCCALGGIGLGQIDFDRLLGRAPPSPSTDDAFDRIAHLFGPLAVENLAGDDRRAERDDAREQDPAGDGIETIVHEISFGSRSRGEMEFAPPFTGELEPLQAAAAALRGAVEHELGGAAVERRQPGLVEPVERLPPALARRLGRAAIDRKVEREMGEDVADARRSRCGSRWRPLAPFAARQRRHSAEQPARRPPHQPHCAVALDPPGDADIAAAARRLRLAAPERPRDRRLQMRRNRRPAGSRRSAARAGRQMVAPRSIIAWAKSPARPAARASQDQRRSMSPRLGAAMRVEPRDHPLDIGVDRRRVARRTRSRRSPPRYSRRSRAARAARPRLSGKPPRRRDCAGAGDEVAGAGIIAEPGPFAEHRLVSAPRRAPRSSASARRTARTAGSPSRPWSAGA